MKIETLLANENLMSIGVASGAKKQLQLINDTIEIMLGNYKTQEAHKNFSNNLYNLHNETLKSELIELSTKLEHNLLHLQQIVSDIRYILTINNILREVKRNE